MRLAPTRTYRNHHLDSLRWEHVAERPDDVVVTTAYKAGTTWMQRIVTLLIHGPGELPAPLFRLSPWVDMRFGPTVEALVEGLDQPHRRVLKSHLPLDGLGLRDDTRYIVVARDTRDVFMSMLNHYGNYTERMLVSLNGFADEHGPFPPAPADPRQFWADWIGRGFFPWETMGWPFWSPHHHVATWWEVRDDPHVLLVHYNDLLADLPAGMRRVAQFLGIDIDEAVFPEQVRQATLDGMRAQSESLLPGADQAWKGGIDTFLYKGTNGRWKDLLGPEDLAAYEDRAAELPPDARAWLERD